MCMSKISFEIEKKINNQNVPWDLGAGKDCLFYIICGLVSNETNCPAIGNPECIQLLSWVYVYSCIFIDKLSLICFPAVVKVTCVQFSGTLSPSKPLETVKQACMLECNGVIFHIIINRVGLTSKSLIFESGFRLLGRADVWESPCDALGDRHTF